MTLDRSCRPHLVYIDSKNDLLYQHHNGSSWSLVTEIDSIGAGGVDGPLFSPQIVLDDSNYAHLTYFDSKGGYREDNNFGEYDKPDLIYATNKTGEFHKKVISYSDGYYFSGEKGYKLVMPPAFIAAGSDYCYIGAEESFLKNNQYYYTYNIYKNDGALSFSQSLWEGTKNDSYFRLFALEAEEEEIYSLFKKSDSLYLLKNEEEICLKDGFSPDGADFTRDEEGNIYAVAVKANRFLILGEGPEEEFEQEEFELPETISSVHKKIVALYGNNTLYVIYTANNGKINVAAKQIKEELPLSSFSRLLALNLKETELTPSFDPEIFNYTAEVSSAVSAINITAVGAEKTRVFIDGEEVQSRIISFEEEEKVVTIEVLAEDGITRGTYTVQLSRKETETENEEEEEEEEKEENNLSIGPPSSSHSTTSGSERFAGGLVESGGRKTAVVYAYKEGTAEFEIKEQDAIKLQIFNSFWDRASKLKIQKMVVKMPGASIIFDQNALFELKQLTSQAANNLVISISPFQMWGRTVLVLKLEVGGQSISSLEDGRIEVQIPYKPPLFKEDRLIVINLGEDSKVEVLETAFNTENILSFATKKPGFLIVRPAIQLEILSNQDIADFLSRHPFPYFSPLFHR